MVVDWGEEDDEEDRESWERGGGDFEGGDIGVHSGGLFYGES